MDTFVNNHQLEFTFLNVSVSCNWKQLRRQYETVLDEFPFYCRLNAILNIKHGKVNIDLRQIVGTTMWATICVTLLPN